MDDVLSVFHVHRGRTMQARGDDGYRPVGCYHPWYELKLHLRRQAAFADPPPTSRQAEETGTPGLTSMPIAARGFA